MKFESNPLKIAIFKRFSKDLNQIHSKFHGLYLFYPVFKHVVFYNIFCVNRALLVSTDVF